jgi:hypothetical protein
MYGAEDGAECRLRNSRGSRNQKKKTGKDQARRDKTADTARGKERTHEIPFQQEFKVVTIFLRLSIVFFTNVRPAEGLTSFFFYRIFLRGLTRRRWPVNRELNQVFDVLPYSAKGLTRSWFANSRRECVKLIIECQGNSVLTLYLLDFSGVLIISGHLRGVRVDTTPS